MKNRPALSVVFPTYNERDNLRELIPKVEEAFSDFPLTIIVVDDQSPDGTADEARALNDQYQNIRVIVPEKRKGLGAAIRQGYDVADSDLILSSDSDQSFSVQDMGRLVETIMSSDCDLVQGARHDGQGRYEAPNLAIKLKKTVSVVGNFVVKHLAGLPISDCSANFRVIKREAWQSIKTVENTNTLLFEMIYKCHLAGFKVCSIPIVFKDRVHGESKLNLFIEVPKFFFKLIYYIVRYRFTGYRI